MGVVVLEGPAAGPHVRPLLGPVALHVQHLQRLQPLQARAAAASSASVAAGLHQGVATSAVSQTGETQGWQ